MSSNILFPSAIVVSCLIIVLVLSLRGRERTEPKKFQLRVPQKKRNNNPLLDLPKTPGSSEVPKKQSLSSWHKKYENDLLHFFEILDGLIFGEIGIAESEKSVDFLTNIEEASLKHPSPEIGAELTAIIGNAKSILVAIAKDPSDPVAEQRKIYQDYRLIWVSRIRQYVDDHERLIRLQNH